MRGADTSRLPPFVAAAQALSGDGRGDGWSGDLRAQALLRYREAGWPHGRTEAWKYTNLDRLGRADFTFAAAPQAAPAPAALDSALTLDACRLVLVNGVVRPDLSDFASLPGGVTVRRYRELAASDRESLLAPAGEHEATDRLPFAALNTATLTDGLMIEIAPGAMVARPLHIVSVGAGENAAFAPHLTVRVGAGAVGEIVESHVGTGDYFSNLVARITVGAGARFGHYRLQNESPTAFHIALTKVEAEAGSIYDNFVLSTGATLARSEIRGRIAGANVDYRINGAYMGAAAQHLDTTTFIDHAAAGSRSREVYKGVLTDTARGVFQGKILVRPDAQQTDGYQMNRALLLSREAEVDSKPELEIYADDVRCSHGATVGDLEEEMIFYLQARGLDEAAARRLLITAYVNEAVDEVQSETVRDALKAHGAVWLATHVGHEGG